MLLKFLEQNHIDEYGNYTDYNFDRQYEIIIDTFGGLSYTLRRISKSISPLYYLSFYEYSRGVYLKIWVNSDSCVIERIQITPTEVVASVGNDNLVLTKVPKMSEETLQVEIIDKEEVILIDVDECAIDKWENQHLDFKDKDLHFIYYDLNNDLYCMRSDFPKELYAYRVCSLAKVLVSNNKIYGVIFKNYKNAKESPNIFM